MSENHRKSRTNGGESGTRTPQLNTVTVLVADGMTRTVLFTLVIATVVLVGATGVAVADQGHGPPNDLPDPVPEFVTDVLDAIGDGVSSVASSLGETISGLTPGSISTTGVPPW